MLKKKCCFGAKLVMVYLLHYGTEGHELTARLEVLVPRINEDDMFCPREKEKAKCFMDHYPNIHSTGAN